MKIEDLDINLTDNSAKLFANELVSELEKLNKNFDTHAMSDYELFLKGKKEMLTEIITYIKKTI